MKMTTAQLDELKRHLQVGTASVSDVAGLLDHIAAVEAERDTARAVLKQLEWSRVDSGYVANLRMCPVCLGYADDERQRVNSKAENFGHKSGCALKAGLDQ